jgi:hypothetical protein
MIQEEHATESEEPMPDSHVVHLRVPDDIHAAILARAQQERRPWSQMCLILLEDALESLQAKRAWPTRKLRLASK